MLLYSMSLSCRTCIMSSTPLGSGFSFKWPSVRDISVCACPNYIMVQASKEASFTELGSSARTRPRASCRKALSICLLLLVMAALLCAIRGSFS